MPNKLLEQALLNRPSITGPVNLPEGDPNAPEAKVLRFAGGVLGNQQPGDLPSALGATTTLSLPMIGKLMSLIKGAPAAAGAAEAIPALKPGFRPNMHEFAPMTEGVRPPINDEMANLAFSQLHRATAGKRPPVTISEMNQMMGANKPDPTRMNSLMQPTDLHTQMMSGSEVAKKMADLKQFREAAAEERGHVIPFPTAINKNREQ
jgi:hypothetical protein